MLTDKKRERDIEKKFAASCRRYGGDAHKLGHSGLPDRLVAWDKGVTTYAELKQEDEDPKPHQEKEIKKLRDKGHLVMVVRTEADMALFISKSLQLVMER